MKSKTGLILAFIIIGLIFSICGFSYAWYNYTREGTNNELIAGDIYLTMDEGSEQLNISGVFPTTVSEARSKDNNFITFTLNGINESDRTIYYEIKLDHGDEKDQPYERFLDSEIHFDLVEIDEDGNELDYLLYNMTFDNFENKRIWVDTVDANTTTEVVKRYKLRAWLDENIIISDTEANATYHATGEHAYKNHYASIKVSVFGDFNEKEVAYGFVNIKKAIAAKTSCTPTKTATNHAGIGGEGNVTYFTGEESCVNFNYVWYSGKLWRITAIYPDGTMKLVTENSMTAIAMGVANNAPFVNTYVNQWIKQEFLPTLYDYQNIIVQNAEWNITTTSSTSDPYLLSNSTTINQDIGLLNSYELAMSKRSSNSSYLIIGQYWFLMNRRDGTTFSVSNNSAYGPPSSEYAWYGNGVRPSIYLRSDVEFSNVSEDNAGKRSNPYRIRNDKASANVGDALNERLIGEYVRFNDQLYRIIDIDGNKTKIVSTAIITNPNSANSSKNLAYFGQDLYYNTTSNSNVYWDNYLTDTENGWVSTLSSDAQNMLDVGTYYLGSWEGSSHYKATICATIDDNISMRDCVKISNSSKIYNGLVGTFRVGEMMAAQQSTTTHISALSVYQHLWSLTPYNGDPEVVVISNMSGVRNSNGASWSQSPSSSYHSIRPTVFLKPEVIITGGTGTANDPYTLTLSS